ncbi:DNA damage inducible protein [Oceanobacillus iheyensis HTE831]|uniref:DNA polymerase IV n=1 Tax=Oceanobacillus iheyensis (strain DSM 14371 / CIP 107618 / JCM 11309 / KCTC 3954 / HTE831) TaxID=221109 RepID=DPO4_OCEIH|nr:DNA polymerase IV [Oceanobacillus iheyensis]Q8EQ56.1 RecName: Full=DNA polymerase IV; Short=Pol IV [Oceanobacillus iheyensis HTE831]BAC13814.1 DNA damage inducible protein [Oceanobacillus iheyensis HTE831]
MQPSKVNKHRIIFHIDMNCFYASVEMAHNPSLKGKPLAIAGNPEERKGIIVTSSYEARGKGVKTTMPIWQAKKLCPDLILMRPNFDRYRAASREIFKMLAEITPYVQPVSIDEGYMDITDTIYAKDPLVTANQLQQRILSGLDIPCSIGIAPNKFLAKMASDMKKPLGITVLRKREVEKLLWPMSVEEMYGIGEKTAQKLNSIEIKTIGDLAKKNVYELKQLLGVNGERLQNRANGIDNRLVDPEAVHDFKSIGSSQTLPHDSTDVTELMQLIHELVDNVERRVKRKEAAGKTVQITIRYHDRKTITRSKKLYNYIDNHREILFVAKELFEQHWNEAPVRLLGVSLQDMETKRNIGEQLDLFTYEAIEKKEKLKVTVDKLTKKYGSNIITSQKNKNESQENQQPRTSFQKDFLDDYKKP